MLVDVIYVAAELLCAAMADCGILSCFLDFPEAVPDGETLGGEVQCFFLFGADGSVRHEAVSVRYDSYESQMAALSDMQARYAAQIMDFSANCAHYGADAALSHLAAYYQFVRGEFETGTLNAVKFERMQRHNDALTAAFR